MMDMKGKSAAVDPRAKLIFSLAVIVVAVLLNSVLVLAVLLFLLVLLALLCGVRPAELGLRLSVVLPFAGIMALWQPFIRGDTVIFSFHGITGTLEGSIFALVLLLRVFVAVAALTIFTATTTETEIGTALRYIRVPGVLVATLLMTLRYLSVLNGRRERIREAQASRLFVKRRNPAGAGWVLRNLAYGVALLFISSYEEGERVYESMVSRGYRHDRIPDPASDGYSGIKNALFCVLAVCVLSIVPIMLLLGFSVL